MPSYRDQYVPPGNVPLESHAFFGPDPAWTPEKEAKTAPHQPNPDRVWCRVCGGEAVQNVDPENDPIRLYETAVVACARCMRSTYEGKLRGRIAAPRDDRGPLDRDDRENRTGKAVRGSEPAGGKERPLTRKERRAAQFSGQKAAHS